MSFSSWRRLSREQRRAWGVISGVVVVGSLAKVAYFNFSRGLILADTERQQREGHARLTEAKNFANWSKQDRDARLPPLTAEQEEQMVRYLRLVEAHGWNKALELEGSKEGECVGCPFLDKKRS